MPNLVRGLLVFIILAVPAAAHAEFSVKTFCRAGNEASCPPHDVFVQCAESIADRAAALCRNNTVKFRQDQAGGQCGITLYSVTCDLLELNEIQSVAVGKAVWIFYLLMGIATIIVSASFAWVLAGKLSIGAIESSRSLLTSDKLLRIMTAIGGLMGIASAGWAIYRYIHTYWQSSSLELITAAHAANEGARTEVSSILPWVAAVIIGIMGISFLAALCVILLVPDTKENQGRIKAADNIVKTFGGFFTGLATTLLK